MNSFEQGKDLSYCVLEDLKHFHIFRDLPVNTELNTRAVRVHYSIDRAWDWRVVMLGAYDISIVVQKGKKKLEVKIDDAIRYDPIRTKLKAFLQETLDEMEDTREKTLPIWRSTLSAKGIWVGTFFSISIDGPPMYLHDLLYFTQTALFEGQQEEEKKQPPPESKKVRNMLESRRVTTL